MRTLTTQPTSHGPPRHPQLQITVTSVAVARLAPRSRSSRSISKLPAAAASISAVTPFCSTRRRGTKGETKVNSNNQLNDEGKWSEKGMQDKSKASCRHGRVGPSESHHPLLRNTPACSQSKGLDTAGYTSRITPCCETPLPVVRVKA